MKFYQKHKKLSTWIIGFFFAAAVILFRELLLALPSIWSALSTLLSIISPFIVGFAIAFILYGPCIKIEKLFKKAKEKSFLNRHARGISVATVYLICVAFIAVILALVIPWLVSSLVDLFNNREVYYGNLNAFLLKHVDENGTFFGVDPQSIMNMLQIEKHLSKINLDQLTQVADGVYQVGSTLIDSILAIFSSVYMLTSRDKLIHSFGRLFSMFTTRKKVSGFKVYLGKISGIFYTYIYSTMLDALIVAICCSIAFIILGVDYAPLFGFIVGAANLVPIFGALICGVGVAVFVAVTDGILKALIVGAVILILQQLDANILQPKLVGESVGIQPLYTLIAITVGGGIFGFWGILLGVPIAATLQLIVSDLMDIREEQLAKKAAEANAENGTSSNEEREFFNFEDPDADE